jgi:hypothetical protein
MVDQLVASARRTLESALVKLGLDPQALLRSETDVLVVYALRRGSADVVVSVGHRGDVAYARVAAPVVVPPADPAARGRLYERLLELNAQGLGNAAFGLFEGRVVAISERPIQGLDESELEQMITHLAAVADSFDDRLAQEFDAKRASDA